MSHGVLNYIRYDKRVKEGVVVMSLVLFVIGVFLFIRSRFSLGSFQTEGRHVKAAGALLMMPATAAFCLSFILGMVFAGNRNSIMTLIGFMAMVELVAMIVGVALAYIMLAEPQGAPRLPGILGDIQDERRATKSGRPLPPRPTNTSSGSASSTSSSTPPRPVESHPLDRLSAAGRAQPVSTRTILNVDEAAQYLGVTGAEIISLIESGKIAAARINYTYQIARSVLDDYKAEVQ